MKLYILKSLSVPSEIIDCTIQISESKYTGEFGLMRDLKLRSAVACPKNKTKQSKTKPNYTRKFSPGFYINVKFNLN